MAMRVPTVDGPSVSEQPLPAVRESSVASPELLGAGAQQMGALGNAAQNLGTEVMQLQTARRKQFDAIRVDDALNQAQEAAVKLTTTPGTGFKDQTGVAALNRDSGIPLADEYTSKLKQQVDQIGNTLTPMQRAQFGAKANDVVRGFYGQALEHERTQRNDYTLSVRDTTVATAKNSITLNPSDPKNVDFQIDRIRGAYQGGQDENGNVIPGSAQMQGKSAAWAKEKADEAVSDAHGNAVKYLMDLGNVNGAMSYFNRYSGQMTAKDVLEVQGRLTKDYDVRQGSAIADQVWQRAQPQVAPVPMDKLTTLVMGAESGGHRYAPDGSLFTSPKGAKGEMQVMDATNRDPGFGVRPAADDSPGERARVGRDYLAAMVVRYPNDLRKALAAYNVGPGAVDKALAEADADTKSGAFHGGQPGADYWLTKLPQETQSYVQNITSKFANGDGAPPRPTLADLHNQVRAQLGPNASPATVNVALDNLTHRFEDQDKALKQRGEEAQATAMRQVAQNGGRFSDLPASVRADLNQYAPDKVDDVLKFGIRIAKGDDTTNSAVYQKLADPNYLRTTSDNQLYALRGQLSQSDYQHFVDERAKLLNPTASTGPGDLNSSAIKNTLDARLRELKIDPTPKDDGGNDAARIGAIRRFVDEQVLSAQRNQGKKFTDAETTAFIDKLAATSPTLHGYVRDYTAPLFAATTGDIPNATKDAIKDALKKQGVPDPTDAQILNAFLHLSVQKKK